jgi:hypothetical protein
MVRAWFWILVDVGPSAVTYSQYNLSLFSHRMRNTIVTTSVEK